MGRYRVTGVSQTVLYYTNLLLYECTHLLDCMEMALKWVGEWGGVKGWGWGMVGWGRGRGLSEWNRWAQAWGRVWHPIGGRWAVGATGWGGCCWHGRGSMGVWGEVED